MPRGLRPHSSVMCLRSITKCSGSQVSICQKTGLSISRSGNRRLKCSSVPTTLRWSSKRKSFLLLQESPEAKRVEQLFQANTPRFLYSSVFYDIVIKAGAGNKVDIDRAITNRLGRK